MTCGSAEAFGHFLRQPVVLYQPFDADVVADFICTLRSAPEVAGIVVRIEHSLAVIRTQPAVGITAKKNNLDFYAVSEFSELRQSVHVEVVEMIAHPLVREQDIRCCNTGQESKRCFAA